MSTFLFFCEKTKKRLLQRLQDFAKDIGHVRHAADSGGAGVALVQGRRNSIFYKWHLPFFQSCFAFADVL